METLKLPAALLLAALLVTVTLPPGRQYGWRRRWFLRFFFAITVVNPCFSVIANDYTFVRDAARSYILRTKQAFLSTDVEEKLREAALDALGVGALKPRRMFAAGAVLRGFQLHSPLRALFDPPAHFGVGVNLLALLDGIAWPASFTLGWAVAEPFWTLGETRDATRGPPHTPSERHAAGEADGEADARLAQSEVRRSTRDVEWRGGGLRIQLCVPSVHLCGMVTTLFLATRRWRWVVLWALGSARWSGVARERAQDTSSR